MKQLGSTPHEARRSFGAAVNVVKDRVAAALETRKAELGAAALAENSRRTASTSPSPSGLIPPPRDEIPSHQPRVGKSRWSSSRIWASPSPKGRTSRPTTTISPGSTSSGTPCPRGPRHSFSRRMRRGERLLLRTHPSPVQCARMLAQKPPIRIIAPGPRAPYWTRTQTHTPMFHQVEGLVIDRDNAYGPSEVGAREFCKAFFEVTDVPDALSPCALPLHRAARRDGHPMRPLGRRAQDRRGRPTGWKSSAAAWCIPMCSRPAGSIPRSGRASPSAWASIASPC